MVILNSIEFYKQCLILKFVLIIVEICLFLELVLFIIIFWLNMIIFCFVFYYLVYKIVQLYNINKEKLYSSIIYDLGFIICLLCRRLYDYKNICDNLQG